MRRATSQTIRQSGRAEPGAGRNGRCREIRRSELVTVPSFSPHAVAGSSTWAWRVVSVCRMQSDTTTRSQSSAARARSASGRLTSGLVDMIQTALMRRSAIASNISTALSPALVRDHRRTPEALHEVAMLRVLDLHMGGELIGEAADFAAAHRIGLAGERERPHAGSSDSPGQQMAVDDRIDLVDAAGRLVDALRIQRDDALGFGEPVEEAFNRATGQPADGLRCA